MDGGAGGFDTLVIGGSYTRIEAIGVTANDGVIKVDGLPIRYAGLEPITLSGTATDVVLTTSASDDVLVLEADSTPAQHPAEHHGTIEQISFANPSTSLTVNLGDGNDILTIGTLDPGFAPTNGLTVNGGNGTNLVHVNDGTGKNSYNFTGITVDWSLGFVHIGGTFDITLGNPGTIDGHSDLKEYAVGLTAGNVFIGTGYGTSAAAGFSATITDLAAALFVDSTGRKWYSVKAQVSGGLVGVDQLSINSGSLSVAYNSDASDGSAALNFGSPGRSVSGSTQKLDFTGATTSVSATGASVSIADVISAQADFTTRRRSSRTWIPMATRLSTSPAAPQTLTVNNFSLAFGGSGFGLAINSGSITVGSLSSTGSTDTRRWSGVQASGLSGSIQLGTVVSAAISGVAVELNSFAGASGATLATALVSDWLGTDNPFGTGSPQLFDIDGDLTNVSLADAQRRAFLDREVDGERDQPGVDGCRLNTFTLRVVVDSSFGLSITAARSASSRCCRRRRRARRDARKWAAISVTSDPSGNSASGLKRDRGDVAGLDEPVPTAGSRWRTRSCSSSTVI